MGESVTAGELPRLSIVLPLFASDEQADNALSSLCAPYQTAHQGAVEILVVEADAPGMLGKARACAYGDNVRHFIVEAGSATRARALDLGLRECRAEFVGLFMEGMHIVTPRTIDTALRALALSDDPLVVLPEYTFDEGALSAADVDVERHHYIRWKEDPYELFARAHFGPANPDGFSGPLHGGACLFARKATVPPPPPTDVDSVGGHALCQWIYAKLSRVPGTLLIVLAGEGGFRQKGPEHQSLASESAEVALDEFGAQHHEPIVFGTIPGPALRFVVESAQRRALRNSVG
jgi:hypothetical protein